MSQAEAFEQPYGACPFADKDKCPYAEEAFCCPDAARCHAYADHLVSFTDVNSHVFDTTWPLGTRATPPTLEDLHRFPLLATTKIAVCQGAFGASVSGLRIPLSTLSPPAECWQEGVLVLGLCSDNKRRHGKRTGKQTHTFGSSMEAVLKQIKDGAPCKEIRFIDDVCSPVELDKRRRRSETNRSNKVSGRKRTSAEAGDQIVGFHASASLHCKSVDALLEHSKLLQSIYLVQVTHPCT